MQTRTFERQLATENGQATTYYRSPEAMLDISTLVFRAITVIFHSSQGISSSILFMLVASLPYSIPIWRIPVHLPFEETAKTPENDARQAIT